MSTSKAIQDLSDMNWRADNLKDALQNENLPDINDAAYAIIDEWISHTKVSMQYLIDKVEEIEK